MINLKIHTEEKTLKSEKHKKLTITFEKKSNGSLFKQLLELIKSWLKK